MKYAVPLKDGEPESCRRYPYNSTIKQNCGIDDFQTENPIPCDKLIFETNEKTLATEVRLSTIHIFFILQIKFIFSLILLANKTSGYLLFLER